MIKQARGFNGRTSSVRKQRAMIVAVLLRLCFADSVYAKEPGVPVEPRLRKHAIPPAARRRHPYHDNGDQQDVGWFSFGGLQEDLFTMDCMACSSNVVRVRAFVPGMYVREEVLPDGETYTPIYCRGQVMSTDFGSPTVPCLGRWIIVPDGAEVVVRVSPSHATPFAKWRLLTAAFCERRSSLRNRL